jgi:hypothetical protein
VSLQNLRKGKPAAVCEEQIIPLVESKDLVIWKMECYLRSDIPPSSVKMRPPHLWHTPFGPDFFVRGGGFTVQRAEKVRAVYEGLDWCCRKGCKIIMISNEKKA